MVKPIRTTVYRDFQDELVDGVDVMVDPISWETAFDNLIQEGQCKAPIRLKHTPEQPPGVQVTDMYMVVMHFVPMLQVVLQNGAVLFGLIGEAEGKEGI